MTKTQEVTEIMVTQDATVFIKTVTTILDDDGEVLTKLNHRGSFPKHTVNMSELPLATHAIVKAAWGVEPKGGYVTLLPKPENL